MIVTKKTGKTREKRKIRAVTESRAARSWRSGMKERVLVDLFSPRFAEGRRERGYAFKQQNREKLDQYETAVDLRWEKMDTIAQRRRLIKSLKASSSVSLGT